LNDTYNSINPSGLRNNVNIKNILIKNNGMFMTWL